MRRRTALPLAISFLFTERASESFSIRRQTELLPLPIRCRSGGSAGAYLDLVENPTRPWAGRAPGLVGVDQFNVAIPSTMREGCAVQLQVSSDALSQPVTISIRKGGGPCSDPPSAGYGEINWEKTVTTSISGADEADVVTISLQQSPGKQAPTLPAFVASVGYLSEVLFGPSCPVPGYRSLDSGTLSVQGPGFGPVQTTVVRLSPSPVSGLTTCNGGLAPGSIQPGAFHVFAGGGADVGGFQTDVDIGQEIQVTTPLAGKTISYTSPFTVNWTGGDSDSVVTLRLIRHLGWGDQSLLVQVPATNGTATLGNSVNGFLPVGDGPVDLTVEVTPDPVKIQTFSAPGLSLDGRHLWKYTYRFEGVVIQ